MQLNLKLKNAEKLRQLGIDVNLDDILIEFGYKV